MFRNLLHILGLINDDSKNTSLEIIQEITWIKWRVFLRGYLIGFLLYPWVWVLGAWILLCGLVWYFVTTDVVIYVSYLATLPTRTSLLPKGSNTEFWFLGILGLGLLINYTISYCTYRKNTALGMLMWILSFWMLLVSLLLVIATWQFNLSYY